jgi:hypothetical protein
MPRGGKRQGAGRIPFWERNDCAWIVRRVREIAESDEMMQRRIHQQIKRRRPSQLEALDELQKNYDHMNSASIEQRSAMFKDDAQTPLEETRAITGDKNFQQYVSVPPPSHFMLSEIYEQVAAEASKRFGTHYPKRSVKRCISACLKLAKALKAPQNN